MSFILFVRRVCESVHHESVGCLYVVSEVVRMLVWVTLDKCIMAKFIQDGVSASYHWRYFASLVTCLTCLIHPLGYCPQITRWSLRDVDVLIATQGQYRAYRWTEYFLLVSDRVVVIHTLTPNIGHYKHCNRLVHFFLWGANVFMLDSNEHYFRSRDLALPQDSHSIRLSACDLWTVQVWICAFMRASQRKWEDESRTVAGSFARSHATLAVWCFEYVASILR
jgi:hypothetical protein